MRSPRRAHLPSPQNLRGVQGGPQKALPDPRHKDPSVKRPHACGVGRRSWAEEQLQWLLQLQDQATCTIQAP